ncbi:MAG: peptidoglycan DD-metalloendopeptidase family protein [Bacteroidetes bacterium]|nr:peptidoglycan DD-metalloendopeptidase family protein [Bacteroidota bacterium]
MMRISLIFFFLAYATSYVASAQLAANKPTTEMKLQQLRNEIAAEELALASTENKEKASKTRLSDLNRQLSLREELVRNYAHRIDQLKLERDSLQASIGNMNGSLVEITNEYQARATHAYKYGRQHDAALILSASSINQMLVRVGYLRRFTLKRIGQLSDIKTSTTLLTEQRTAMQQKLVETEMILTNVDREQNKLDLLRKEVASELKKIKAEKDSRVESIAEKRTMEHQLVDLIQTYLATNSRRAVPSIPSTMLPLNLSEAFASAVGSLEWPVSGPVLEPFGEIVHPKYGTKTPNPGILIKAPASTEVNSVFAGKVTTIDFIPDMGRFIIIEHGDYHTVYGNFSLIYVSQGDMIETGQLIGRSGTESEPRGASVFFAVFKGGVPQDPARWLN